MRILMAVAVAAPISFGAAAQAADVPASSKIDGVTVFPSGAEVTRAAKVRIEAGEHVVLFTDLPAQAVPGSIRVEGKSTGRLEIGSVDTRRVMVPRTDPAAQATERRRIEEAIEKLRDERALVEAQQKAVQRQLALIEKLTELPQHPAPVGAGGAAQPDWGQLLTLIGQRSGEAQRSLLEFQLKFREIDRKIEDLEKKLATLTPAQVERTEVKVFVSAGNALEAELAIRYQVTSAGWTPYYDARLATGGRSAPAKLALVRRASIQQRTGEDWVDVALQLSTTRPGSGTAAPELFPITVDFEPDIPVRPPPVAAPAPRARMEAERAGEDAVRSAVPASPKLAAAPAIERQAQVEAAPFQVTFAVPGRLTVLATGEQKRAQLDAVDLDPTLVVRTAPRVNPKAFLYAKLASPRATPYLPGQVSLFRDGTFVGNGRLPQLAPGEEFELGFGPDDNIRVRHALVEEKRGESGLISASKTDVRNYRISVKNQHERPIQLSILDQIPVSQNQEIKVDLVTRVQPSRQNVDDKRGVLAWDFELKPDEERVLEFGYRVQWPAAKKVQYGR
jgi:uncharacterized protein (TIGR02231 family)